jgi:hypothetical protein
MGLFVNKYGITRYLTGNKITDVLCSVTRAAHPDMPEDEIKRFSSHSSRVRALILSDKAGMTPDFMKSHLRWMTDSYSRLYLRDTSILQCKHADALDKDSVEIQPLLEGEIVASYLTSFQRMMKWENIIPSFYSYFFSFFCMVASHNGVV